MRHLYIISIIALLSVLPACLAVQCFKCTDHAPRGTKDHAANRNATNGTAANGTTDQPTGTSGTGWRTCDKFNADGQPLPRSSEHVCTGESCIKKTVSGLVSRYCGQRLQEDGCRHLPEEGGITVRCACAEDLCNGAHRADADLALMMMMLMMLMMVVVTVVLPMFSPFGNAPVDLD